MDRRRRQFTDSEWKKLMPLADVLGRRLIDIQSFERRIQAVYGQVETFVRDRTQVRQALGDLMDKGVHQVQINEILSILPERAFQKGFKEMLNALAQKRAWDETAALGDEELATIYNEVPSRGLGKVPELNDAILSDLRTVSSALSIAYGFHHRFTQRDWSEEYIPLYQACQSALNTKTVNDIIGQQGGIENAITKLREVEGIPLAVMSALAELNGIACELERAEKRPLEGRHEQWGSALVELDAIEQMVDAIDEGLVRLVFVNWGAQWKRVILAALPVESTEVVKLKLALRSEQALPLEYVDAVLQVRNLGPGVATQVTADLLPNRAEYEIVGDRHFNLEDLRPHQLKEAEFVIKPQNTDDLGLRFQVGYQDSQGTWPKKLNLLAQFSLEGKMPTYEQLENPYVVGRPLKRGSRVFFGRDDVFELVEQSVDRRPPHVLVLVGGKRIGKTSIARQLPDRVQAEGYIHVYFDVQKVAASGLFLHGLAECITKELKDTGIEIQCPSREEFRSDPVSAFEYDLLPYVREYLDDRNQRLLIAIDEYEVLEDKIEDEREDPRVLKYLRALMQESGRMAFVFFASHRIGQGPDFRCTLFDIADYRPIDLLGEEDARELIEEPEAIKGKIVYDELAVKEILRGTGGHPYFLQLVCYELIESCRRDEVSYVTLQRVRHALRKVVELGGMHLRWLWRKGTSAEQRAVLIGLTECVRRGELGTAGAILERAREVGLTLEPRAANRALAQLVRRQILTRPQGRGFCEFTASLYYDWIRQEHPLALEITA
jgi:hypothetical protein